MTRRTHDGMLTLQQRARLAKDWWDGDELNADFAGKRKPEGDPGQGSSAQPGAGAQRPKVDVSKSSKWWPEPLDPLLEDNSNSLTMGSDAEDRLDWANQYITDHKDVDQLLRAASTTLNDDPNEPFEDEDAMLDAAGNDLFEYQKDVAMRCVWQLAKSVQEKVSDGERQALKPLLILDHATGSGKTRSAVLISRVMTMMYEAAYLRAHPPRGSTPPAPPYDISGGLVSEAIGKIAALLPQENVLTSETISDMHNILVVVKKTTMPQWKNEFWEFSPQFRMGRRTFDALKYTIVVVSDVREAKEAYHDRGSRDPTVYIIPESHVLLSLNPENQMKMLNFDIAGFVKKVNIGVGIFDEVQGLRGKVKRFNIEAVCKACFFSICLSGTPLVNKAVRELYMTIGMLSGDLGAWTKKVATEKLTQQRVQLEAGIPYVHRVTDADVPSVDFEVKVQSRTIPFYMQSPEELELYNASVRRCKAAVAPNLRSSDEGGDADDALRRELEDEQENELDAVQQAVQSGGNNPDFLGELVEAHDDDEAAFSPSGKKRARERQLAYNKVKRYTSLPSDSWELEGATVNPKTEFVTGMILKPPSWYDENRESRKWVVASYNVQHLKSMVEHFEKLPGEVKHGNTVNLYEIHGDIPMDKRVEAMDAFKKADGSNFEILFLGIQAGGEGIRLAEASLTPAQNCRNMIITDMAWNVAKMRQTIARIARLGQNNPKVNVYVMLVENSLDIATAQLVLDKQKAITALLKNIRRNANLVALEERIAIQKTTLALKELSASDVTFYNARHRENVDRSFITTMRQKNFDTYKKDEINEKLEKILY